jgi:hypothetical protein
VLFVRYAGKQDARPAPADGKRGDGLAQQALGEFGKQMFIEYLEAAVLPGFADAPGQRRHRVLDKTLQALSGKALLHGLLISGTIALFDQREQSPELLDFPILPRSTRHQRTPGKPAQFFRGCRDQFPRPVALIHQAFDQAQALDLLGRVAAFAIGVAAWRRETITAFPDAQNVLR